MFGELIGLWAVEIWHAHGPRRARSRLVELGPGRGTLMRDVLRAARVVPGFLEAAARCSSSRPARCCAQQQQRRACRQRRSDRLARRLSQDVPDGPR